MITGKLPPIKQSFLAIAAFIALSVLLPAPAFAETGEKASRQDFAPAHQVGKRPAAQPAKASSEQWKMQIWEILPYDAPVGPPRPDPVRIGYQRSGWKPFFVDSCFEINESGRLVIERLHSLQDEAIDPAPYQFDRLQTAFEKLDRARAALRALRLDISDTASDALLSRPPQAEPSPGVASAGEASGPSPPPAQMQVSIPEQLRLYREAFRAAAEFDIALAAAFSRFANEMNPFSGEEQSQALCGMLSMAQILKDLEPQSRHYRALIADYARYRELAAKNHQQPFSASASLRPGESGNHVRELQKRLQQEGLYSGSITGFYDAETQRGVREFQSMHLVEPDGVVGQRTREWLNVPFRDKADMIAYAMNYMRQSQSRRLNRYIRINIPQFLLEYYRDGKIEATHRVVVGRASGKKVKFRGRMIGENQTPTLVSTIEQIILNPRWYVSDRIQLELNSEAKSDPEWFTRHGYVAWGQNRIFQRPGPKNALGRVKFEFPNVYAVYLHDTPQKSLFERARRDFSHGCIRVDKALRLAELLLSEDNSPYAQKMETVLKGDKQTFVRLTQPIPILIEYIPVSTNDNGRALFLGDPYGILKEGGNRKT